MERAAYPSISALLVDHIATGTTVSVATLQHLAALATSSPLASDLLQIDPPLWGGFWQFDVLSPGYTLPASELNLLRGIRLDATWPDEATVATYQADLHQAIHVDTSSLFGVLLHNHPFAVWVTPTSELLTVVWYSPSTGRIHAGYRTPSFNWYDSDDIVPLTKAIPQQGADGTVSAWLDTAVEQYKEDHSALNLTSQLDYAILRLRLQTA